MRRVPLSGENIKTQTTSKFPRRLKLSRKVLVRIAIAVYIVGLVMALSSWNMFFRDGSTGFEEVVAFNVYPNSSVEQIADSLVHNQILAKRRGFVWLANLTGWGDQIKAGHYEAKVGFSAVELLSMLRSGDQTPIHMVVPGGTRKERLIRGMARKMAFSEDELAAALNDPSLAAELKTDTTHLWAAMIPDTYYFFWLTKPEDVVRRLKTRYDNLIQSVAENGKSIPENLTADEVLRMAGIVEWESAYVPEKATIAGVYFNRIRNKWPLQADPTVQYAIMKREGEKRRLLFADYKLNDPYNTYKYRGLPPGPITNPSITSIQSVLEPESHTYFFFVAKGDGQHIFSRTLSEHTRNAQEYYRVMRAKRAAEQATEAS